MNWKMIFAILIAVGSVTACTKEEGSAAPAGRTGMKVAPAATVQGHTIESAEFEVLRDYGGEFNSDAMANLSAEVSGIVRSVNVRLGDVVKKGDILAEVDPVTYQQRVRELEASVSVAEASLEESRAQKSNLEADLQRRLPLLDRQLVSAREIEDLQAQVAIAGQRIEVAQATLQQNKARLSTGRVSLQDTQVRAPFDGIVAERFVDIGAHVNTGQSLFRVVDDTEIYLQLRIAETDSGMVTLGMPVVIRVDGLGGTTIPGTVGRIAPAVDVQTRTMRVDVLAPDGEKEAWARVKPGMYARAQIQLNKKENAIIAPSQAVLKDRDGTRYVWVVEENKSHRREVKPGLKNRSSTEILEGLKPGEVVVLRGHEKLTDKGSVQLVREVDGETP